MAPIRTCVVCRTKRPQAELLRFFRLETGGVHLWNNAATGRSAYCCQSIPCLEGLNQKGRLSRAFKGRIEENSIEMTVKSVAESLDRNAR